MGENFKKFLLLFLGCVIGLGGFSALSRNFKDDEKDKKPVQEETVDDGFDGFASLDAGTLTEKYASDIDGRDGISYISVAGNYVRIYATGVVGNGENYAVIVDNLIEPTITINMYDDGHFLVNDEGMTFKNSDYVRFTSKEGTIDYGEDQIPYVGYTDIYIPKGSVAVDSENKTQTISFEGLLAHYNNSGFVSWYVTEG